MTYDPNSERNTIIAVGFTMVGRSNTAKEVYIRAALETDKYPGISDETVKKLVEKLPVSGPVMSGSSTQQEDQMTFE